MPNESTPYVEPTRRQIEELIGSEGTGPVVMLNLLKFRDRTADGTMSGREAYAKYGAGVLPMLAAVGGRLLWQGSPDSVVIGPDTDRWDLVLLVEYPSRAKFLEMVTNPGYTAVGVHRTAALADSRLVACTAVNPAG
ncbi:MAG: DUF1330 domain-containing protein [Acidimicrobiia bacterium]